MLLKARCLIVVLVFFIFYLHKNNKKNCYNIKLNNKIIENNSDYIINSEKVLVIYAYFEKNTRYIENFQFFIDFGITESNNTDYILIIQGYRHTAKIPNFKNIRVIKRENNCFDFGAYGKILSLFGEEQFILSYNAIIFLNPSAVGPILPKYFPERIHWSEIFLSRLKEDVHAVSTSLVCLPENDLGGVGPRLEGMAFAATSYAVLLAFNEGVFDCKTNKVDAILNGEYKFTKVLLENGLNLDSLLMKYNKIDWRKKENWQCNKRMHPTRYNAYDGISVNPLEVVFHKPLWDNGSNFYLHDVYYKETVKYMKWARSRLNPDMFPSEV